MPSLSAVSFDYVRLKLIPSFFIYSLLITLLLTAIPTTTLVHCGCSFFKLTYLFNTNFCLSLKTRFLTIVEFLDE